MDPQLRREIRTLFNLSSTAGLFIGIYCGAAFAKWMIGPGYPVALWPIQLASLALGFILLGLAMTRLRRLLAG